MHTVVICLLICSQSVMKEKMRELEKNLEMSNTTLQEEKVSLCLTLCVCARTCARLISVCKRYTLQERVKRRDKQLAKLDVTTKNYSTQLDTVKAELQEVKDSKQAVKVECQQIKVRLTIYFLNRNVVKESGHISLAISSHNSCVCIGFFVDTLCGMARNTKRFIQADIVVLVCEFVVVVILSEWWPLLVGISLVITAEEELCY